MPPEYYKLGGKGDHTRRWFARTVDTKNRTNFPVQDVEALADAIAGPNSLLRRNPNSPVELTLGVYSSGATCLLLTAPQASTMASFTGVPVSRNHPPLRPADFVSLSPIEFPSAEHLTKKLKSLVPRGKQSGHDDSQANKAYIGADVGKERGMFEHGRVFFKLLKEELDPRKFNISDAWSASTFCLISMTFTTWTMDHRSRTDRLRDPKLLDVGWVETSVPELVVKQDSTTHLTLADNAIYTNKDKDNFLHGNTDKVSILELRERIRLRLEAHGVDPIVLLVLGEERTRHFLRICGVDGSRFVSGLDALLYDEEMSSRSKFRSPPGDRRSRSPQRKYGDSSAPSARHYPDSSYRHRSRSPQHDHRGKLRQTSSSERHYHDDRRQPDQWATSSGSQRHERHPNRSSQQDPTQGRETRAQRPIYLVDVLKMGRVVMKSGDLNDDCEASVLKLTSVLREPHTLRGWCAGNECHLLFNLWLSMIAGSPVDEQGVERNAKVVASIQNHEASGSRDPNDFVPGGVGRATAIPAPYGYGSSDDDSE